MTLYRVTTSFADSQSGKEDVSTALDDSSDDVINSGHMFVVRILHDTVPIPSV